MNVFITGLSFRKITISQILSHNIRWNHKRFLSPSTTLNKNKLFNSNFVCRKMSWWNIFFFFICFGFKSKKAIFSYYCCNLITMIFFWLYQNQKSTMIMIIHCAKSFFEARWELDVRSFEAIDSNWAQCTMFVEMTSKIINGRRCNKYKLGRYGYSKSICIFFPSVWRRAFRKCNKWLITVI